MFAISAFCVVFTVIIAILGQYWIPDLGLVVYTLFLVALFFFGLGLVTTAIKQLREIFKKKV